MPFFFIKHITKPLQLNLANNKFLEHFHHQRLYLAKTIFVQDYSNIALQYTYGTKYGTLGETKVKEVRQN
jgi:hypothetical protein